MVGRQRGDRTYFERVCSRRCAQHPYPTMGTASGCGTTTTSFVLPPKAGIHGAGGRGRVRLTCTTPNRQATPQFHHLVRPWEGHSDSERSRRIYVRLAVTPCPPTPRPSAFAQGYKRTFLTPSWSHLGTPLGSHTSRRQGHSQTRLLIARSAARGMLCEARSDRTVLPVELTEQGQGRFPDHAPLA